MRRRRGGGARGGAAAPRRLPLGDGRHALKRDLHDIVTAHDRASEALIVRQHPRRGAGLDLRRRGGRPAGRRAASSGSSTRSTAPPTSPAASPLVRLDRGRGRRRVVAGVIHDPVAGETFRGRPRGRLARTARPLTRRRRPDEGERSCSPSFPSRPPLRDVGERAPSRRTGAARRLPGAPQSRQRRAAARLCRGRMGRRHPRLLTNPWDVAAGALILERAGGRFVGLDAAATLAAAAFWRRDYSAWAPGRLSDPRPRGARVSRACRRAPTGG